MISSNVARFVGSTSSMRPTTCRVSRGNSLSSLHGPLSVMLLLAAVELVELAAVVVDSISLVDTGGSVCDSFDRDDASESVFPIVALGVVESDLCRCG